MIGVVTLYTVMVTVVEGVIVRFPELSLPLQNMPPRLTLFKTKGLPDGPPVAAFQTTWTFRTVTGSCGLVIVRLIVGLPPVILIAPVVMLPQPGTGVEVEVGVKVTVGVEEAVKVGVTVGVSVGVLLGRGVNVITGPDGDVAVGVSPDGTVAVGVSVTTVAVGPPDGEVAVAVFDELLDVGAELSPLFISRIPNIVRALDEVIGRELIGIRFTIGPYIAVTVTCTRSGTGPEFTTTPVSRLPVHVSNELVPGPLS